MYEGKLGVAIVSFNRHDYLEKLLTSLEENTYLDNTDFILFQDGAINRFSKAKAAEQEDIDKAIDVFRESSLPNKGMIAWPENVSIAINQFEMSDWMSRHYDYILFMENDVVVSPYYLRIIRILIDQFLDNPEVFSVGSVFKRVCTKENIKKNLNKVQVREGHWWAEAFSAEKWKIMRPYFLEYYKFVKEIDYGHRPRNQIREFFHNHGHDVRATSQDSGKGYALMRSGLCRVKTVVNRCISIGERGVHFSPKSFKRHGLHNQKPYIFESDAKIKKFK